MQASNNNETSDDTVYIHYDTAFPELHGASTLPQTNGASKPKPIPVKPCLIKSNIVREFIEIPCSERKNQISNGASNPSGKKHTSLSQLATDLSKKHKVEVDINSSRSQSLTIVISGAPDNVALAKCAVVRSLQTQSKLELRIDPKYHRFIIGKGGQTLTSMERETTTKIHVPSPNSAECDIITVTGPKHGCDAAKLKLMNIVDTHSKLSNERISIPKIYHPFIRGPGKININRWFKVNKVRIDMPPPTIMAEDICVSGEKKAVDEVLAEIDKIYKTNCAQSKRCVINVRKSQHRLVNGPKGAGLDDILEKTGVSVDLPQGETDEVVLLGPPTKMGTAMSMVIEKASSSIRDEIEAPNRFYGVLIGKSGAALDSLLEGYKGRVNVDFGGQNDRIEIDGPTEDVAAVKSRLLKRLKELEQTMAIETIRIPSKYHGFVVGREGGNIRRIREKYNCQININKLMDETSEITVEGETKNISQAANEIREFVKRLENEKVKDHIIEPDIQILLCASTSGKTAPIRVLYEEFPKIAFHCPVFLDNQKNVSCLTDPANSVCQVTGPRQDVDAFSEKLTKLVKSIKESNYHQEFRVFKEFRPHFFGRENNKVKAILNELQCRKQNPPAGGDSTAPPDDKSSELWWIVGQEKQVHQAIDRIDALQRQVLNMKEVRLPIPLFVYFSERPNLRSIKEQCDGVGFKYSEPMASVKELTVYGPSEAVAKAKKLIEELNNKSAELSEEVVVPCDKKFHGMLIGRSGQNIAAFRDKYKVELVFPERYETNPNFANQIHIYGSKINVPIAKEELFKQIKALEDETEVLISVPSEFLRNIRQAHKKLQERAHTNLNFPKVSKKSSSKISSSVKEKDEENCGKFSPEIFNNNINNEDIELKLSGPKAIVESTKQSLQLLINDLKEFSKTEPREFILKDKHHVRVIGGMKYQLPDFEVEYHVIIKVDIPSREEVDTFQPIPIGQSDEKFPVIGKVLITGRPEQIDAVWDECFKPLLSVTRKFTLEKDLHRYLVVVDSPQRGSTKEQKKQNQNPKETPPSEHQNKVSQLQKACNLIVKVPPANQQDSNFITLHGTPAQISAAEELLKSWVVEWIKERADKIARSYEETIEVKECYLPILSAQKFEQLRSNCDVVIRIIYDNPRGVEKIANSEEDQSVKDIETIDEKEEITEDEFQEPLYPADTSLMLLSERTKSIFIRGYKENVEKARVLLEKYIEELTNQERVILNIPQMVHSQLIGAKRSRQLRLQKDYNVQIEFPGRNARGDSAHIVVVMGPKNKVDEACDHIISVATDLLDKQEARPSATNSIRSGGICNLSEVIAAQINDKQQKDTQNSKPKQAGAGGGVVITGAPWDKTKG